MDNKDEEEKWFKNINKSDTGAIVDIIPSENVRLRASSSNPGHIVRNLTDNNPSTKWVSNYTIGTYKDEFYTNRKITKGDYSRGQIVNDGKNRKLAYDNQKQKEILRNKIISLKNKMNKQVEIYNNNKKRIKMVEPKTQKDFKKKIKYKYKERYHYYLWFWRTRTRIGTKWVNDTAKYNQYLKANNNMIRELKHIGNNIYRTKNTFKIEDAKLKAQLNDIPSIDVNSLPVKVTNDGKYPSNTKTILANNSIINGEWIEVEIPQSFVVNQYSILPGMRDGTNELTPFPKDFYMVGSNDTNKWEILDSQFDYTPVYSSNSPIEFNIDNKKKYKYVRLVISSLNGAYTGFQGLGAVSLSIFNIVGNYCYTLNKSCETFQSYSNKNNTMSKIEGLTMMDANINVLADLKEFNQKYQKYVKCTDITLPESAKTQCTEEDTNITTVNAVYDKLMDNGSIQKLQDAPLTKYISTNESNNNHTNIVKTHNEIMPLRKELDAKMNQLMDSESSIYDEYNEKYDMTMYSSLVLSVILTSSLFFIFKKL